MAKKTFKVTGADYEIAKEQLQRLRVLSQERLLSFEEVKIYDLLVKNLKVSKNDPEETQTVISDKERKLLSKNDAELVEIALGAEVRKVLVPEIVEEPKPSKKEPSDE